MGFILAALAIFFWTILSKVRVHRAKKAELAAIEKAEQDAEDAYYAKIWQERKRQIETNARVKHTRKHPVQSKPVTSFKTPTLDLSSSYSGTD